jgi:adenosylhomocysteine nucleosidase
MIEDRVFRKEHPFYYLELVTLLKLMEIHMQKLTRLLLILILQVLSFNVLSQVEYGPRDFNVDDKWTAIVAAFEPEINAINEAFANIDDAQIDKIVTIKGVKYQIGTYKGEPIVIFTTGISVPNAAMTMQMALDYFPIDKVVMMGIAGAVNPAFKAGDIAIPERWYFHDESVYVNPNPNKSGEYILPEHYEKDLERYKARESVDPNAPKYKNHGFIHPREVSVIRDGYNRPQKMPYFTVSSDLFKLAKKALITIDPIKMPSGKPINIILGGNGVTGSVYADSANYRLWLRDVFTAEVTEMESAAVGQVCFVNGVDWIIIRSISDLAGAQKGQNQVSVFDSIASGTATKLMIGLLDQINIAESM